MKIKNKILTPSKITLYVFIPTLFIFIGVRYYNSTNNSELAAYTEINEDWLK